MEQWFTHDVLPLILILFQFTFSVFLILAAIKAISILWNFLRGLF